MPSPPAPEAPQRLHVDAGGDRLDRWLARARPDLSRAYLQSLIASGYVARNGRRCTAKQARLQRGDWVQLALPAAPPQAPPPEAWPLDVLYEDACLLALNKPAGWVVHPAPGHASGTVVNALLAHCDSLSGLSDPQRPGIVHRLDRDTSGAMAVAKTDAAHRSLQAQIQARTARRHYLGLVRGCPHQREGTIEAPIGRHPRDRKKMAVLASGGQPARTRWRLLEAGTNWAAIAFELETGRTHQVRVHAAHLGHPILGDPVYSSGSPKGLALTGQALHAWCLQLAHPHSGEPLEVVAPLPAELTQLRLSLQQRWG
ncbi:MAG: RluA family pseudouridine synthase [Cyanobacteria bacterium QS_8_64_29]|nr:MAG: RluA family pseudouridine synthase [Cyanobacteria bacterium QS_8_64_29]